MGSPGADEYEVGVGMADPDSTGNPSEDGGDKAASPRPLRKNTGKSHPEKSATDPAMTR